MNELLLVIPALVVILILAVVWKLRHKPGLSARARRKALSSWEQACALQDPHRRVLEADKVLDLILGELGYQGSVAEKLRKAEKFIPAINDVWNAHKLRNRIAHESGMQVTEQEVARAMAAFGRVVDKFVR